MADQILPLSSGIYSITNKINGKRYIGSAVNINSRLRTHRSLLNRDCHCNIKLQRAWNKYGSDSFSFDVIEYVENKTDLIIREQFWIDNLDAASKKNYNILANAGSSLGYKHTEESNAKRSASLKGRPRAPEVVAKMGRKHSKETIEKIRAGVTGKKRSPEVIAKMKLLSPSLEQRAKISATLMGRKRTPESIEKSRIASIGRKMSKESLEKRVASWRKTMESKKSAKLSAE